MLVFFQRLADRLVIALELDIALAGGRQDDKQGEIQTPKNPSRGGQEPAHTRTISTSF